MLDSRTLPNGLRVLTAVLPHSHSVTVSFYFGAGSRYEQPPEAGISHLVEHLCFKGTERRPRAQQISEAIEGVGGVLNAATDRELTVYYAKVPQAHWAVALDVVTDVVLHPCFDAREFEKERQVILEELAMVEDNPGQLVEVELDRLLWPGQALGRDVAGSVQSVQGLQRDRTMSYRREQYAPANALIAVAGKLEPDAVMAATSAVTAEWDFGAPRPWERAATAAADHVRVGLRRKPTEQAHLVVGLIGLALDDPDRFALHLLAGVLGDGMSSRLFVQLREERGLVYDVHAYSANFLDTGALGIYLAVDPANAVEVLTLALCELGRIRDGVPAAELDKAREYSKGRMLLSMEDTRAVSAWYGAQALLQGCTRSVDDLIADLDAVTPDDVARVAQRLIQDERLHLAVVGPFDSAEPFEQALRL